MVTQNMLRTHEGKEVFLYKKKKLVCGSRSNQMPEKVQITSIAPYVGNYIRVTI